MRDRKNTLKAQCCQVQLKMSADNKVELTHEASKKRSTEMIKMSFGSYPFFWI